MSIRINGVVWTYDQLKKLARLRQLVESAR